MKPGPSPPILMAALALLSTIVCLAVNAYTYRIAYPLWRVTSPADFPRIHAAYLRLLTPIITLPHIAMFFSTAALIVRPPSWLPRPAAITIFTLATLVILLSAFVAGPIHSRFTRTASCDAPGLDRLIRLSALRTILMAAATALLLACLQQRLALIPGHPGVNPLHPVTSTFETRSPWRTHPAPSATIEKQKQTRKSGHVLSTKLRRANPSPDLSPYSTRL